MSLTRSLITRQLRPILDQLLVRLGLRQGQALPLIVPIVRNRAVQTTYLAIGIPKKADPRQTGRHPLLALVFRIVADSEKAATGIVEEMAVCENTLKRRATSRLRGRSEKTQNDVPPGDAAKDEIGFGTRSLVKPRGGITDTQINVEGRLGRFHFGSALNTASGGKIKQ